MKNISKRFLSLFTFILSAAFALAQQPNDVEMADAMRSNGKIYVVVTVLLIILAGLILFLIRIDKKVSRLEKKNPSNS